MKDKIAVKKARGAMAALTKDEFDLVSTLLQKKVDTVKIVSIVGRSAGTVQNIRKFVGDWDSYLRFRKEYTERAKEERHKKKEEDRLAEAEGFVSESYVEVPVQAEANLVTGEVKITEEPPEGVVGTVNTDEHPKDIAVAILEGLQQLRSSNDLILDLLGEMEREIQSMRQNGVKVTLRGDL